MYSFDRRLGTNLTDENYLALRIKSVETNMTTQALLNAAVEQCFVNGGLDMELARNTRRPADTKETRQYPSLFFLFPTSTAFTLRLRIV